MNRDTARTKPDPRNPLDAWLRARRMPLQRFALLVRALRRHPTSPTAAMVSHWRCGRRRPSHDLRVFIEAATEGAVSLESWGAPTP